MDSETVCRYEEFKRFQVAAAAELVRSFLWDNGYETTGLVNAQRGDLRDNLSTLIDALTLGKESDL